MKQHIMFYPEKWAYNSDMGCISAKSLYKTKLQKFCRFCLTGFDNSFNIIIIMIIIITENAMLRELKKVVLFKHIIKLSYVFINKNCHQQLNKANTIQHVSGKNIEMSIFVEYIKQ